MADDWIRFQRTSFFGFLGLLSGLLSTAAAEFHAGTFSETFWHPKQPNKALDWILLYPVPGLIFGVLMVVALFFFVSMKMWQWPLFIAFSAGGYYSASWIAFNAICYIDRFTGAAQSGVVPFPVYLVSGLIGGLVGSFIYFWIGGFICCKPMFAKSRYLTLWGGICGMLLAICSIEQGGGVFLIYLFIILWQTMVAAAIGYWVESRKAS